jgi:peptidoglycan LD-endopeptidase LytH
MFRHPSRPVWYFHRLMPLRHLVPLLLLAGCNPAGAIRGFRDEPRTGHERYARALRDAGLDSTAAGRDWLRASDSALAAPIALVLPAREVGLYQRAEARAVAYRFALRDGERLRVTLRADGLPTQLYLDLFEPATDSSALLEHRATAARATSPDSAANVFVLTHEATRTSDYVLRLQPELLRSGRFDLTIATEPTLAFPVEGHGNAAIQSLFGVARDGGRRAHHGIDIFAPRGTPVLAGTDGVVRSIAPNELGGNVVWLSDEQRGQTLYYAHLDRHHVAAGQRVRTGDTLGFVGNTGNARSTPPHLHFGIYRRPEGPIDPLRFVRINTARPPALRADTAQLGRFAVPRASNTALRAAAAESSAVVRRMARGTRVQIVAVTGGTYRVQLDDGVNGYLSNIAITAAER